MSRDIVFVNSLFPCLSETFVFDQFTVLQGAGMHFHLVSNNRPAENKIHPRMRSIQEKVLYLCEATATQVLKAHFVAFIKHPMRYLRALPLLFSSEENLRTAIAQFTGATLILAHFSKLKKIHLHAHFTYGAAAVALWANRIADVPYSLTLHGSDLIFDNPPDLADRLINADGIVSISKFNVDYLKKHFPELGDERVRIIRMGVPPFDPNPVRPASDQCLKILNIGRLSVHKAQHDLISACAILRDKGVVFSCSIVGEGELHSVLNEQIENLGLSKSVELLGARFHDEVLSLYKQHDLFVLCSITEGQPVVLMEAMRAGIPIIASNISAIPELLQCSGTLVPADNPSELAAAIQAFAANRGKYHELAIKASKIVATEYNLEKNHLSFKAYLDQLS